MPDAAASVCVVHVDHVRSRSFDRTLHWHCLPPHRIYKHTHRRTHTHTHTFPSRERERAVLIPPYPSKRACSSSAHVHAMEFRIRATFNTGEDGKEIRDFDRLWRRMGESRKVLKCAVISMETEDQGSHAVAARGRYVRSSADVPSCSL